MKHRLEHLDEAQRRDLRRRWCPKCGAFTLQLPHHEGWKCMRKGHVLRHQYEKGFERVKDDSGEAPT